MLKILIIIIIIYIIASAIDDSLRYTGSAECTWWGEYRPWAYRKKAWWRIFSDKSTDIILGE